MKLYILTLFLLFLSSVKLCAGYYVWHPDFVKYDIKPTQEELRIFDTDNDGYLNEKERNTARKILIANKKL